MILNEIAGRRLPSSAKAPIVPAYFHGPANPPFGRAVCDAGLKAHSVDSSLPTIECPDLKFASASDEHRKIEGPNDTRRHSARLIDNRSRRFEDPAPIEDVVGVEGDLHPLHRGDLCRTASVFQITALIGTDTVFR